MARIVINNTGGVIHEVLSDEDVEIIVVDFESDVEMDKMIKIELEQEHLVYAVKMNGEVSKESVQQFFDQIK